MKKYFVLNVILLLTVVFASFGAYAEEGFKSYSLDEAGITVSIPDNYAVFTRETSSDDSRLYEYGLTYDGIMAMFEANSIYLDAFDSDGNYEIVVIAEETKEKNFSECSEKELTQASDSEEARLRSENAVVSSSDVFETESADFIKTVMTDKDGYDAVQYLTVSAGRKICVRISSYTGEFSDSAISLCEKITRSITFNKPSSVDSDDAGDSQDTENLQEDTSETTQKVSSDADESGTGGIPNFVLYIVIGILVIVILIVLIVKR